MHSDFYIDLTMCKIPLGGSARHYQPGEDPVIVRTKTCSSLYELFAFKPVRDKKEKETFSDNYLILDPESFLL